MKKNWKRFALVSMIMALSAVMVFATAAIAQGNGPMNQPSAGNAQANRNGSGSSGIGQGSGLAVRGAWGGHDGSLVATAATVIGIEQAALVAELADGPQSIAAVATAHNVSVQAIVDAALAPRSQMIAQAVADGRLTQAQADAMLAAMQAQLLVQINETWTAQGNGNGNGACTGDCSGTPGQGMGANWVDADGDGVCDNASGAQHSMRGQGQHSGRSGGRMGGRGNH